MIFDAYISPKCEFWQYFGTHKLTHNLKANVFILKAKNFDFRGTLTITVSMRIRIVSTQLTRF